MSDAPLPEFPIMKRGEDRQQVQRNTPYFRELSDNGYEEISPEEIEGGEPE